MLRQMPRGRNPKVSDERLLLEILLQPDRAVFSSEIAEHVPVGQERVRQRLRGLADDGYVDIKQLESQNVYRLTEEGYEHLATVLRERLS